MTHPDNMLTIAKGIGIMATSGVIYLAEMATGILGGAPEWVTQLGLPITMLFLAITGLVKMFQGWAAEKESRINDRKEDAQRWQETYLKHAESSQASREKLIEATTRQNILTEQLVEKIEKAIEKR